MPNSNNRGLSIILPCHNAQGYIGQTLSTIMKKIPRNSEVIVVENGSVDASYLTAVSFAELLSTEHKVIRVIRSRKGLGNALRNGSDISTGEILAFMADDLPFGVQEIETVGLCKKQPASIFAISKYLPESDYESSLSRRVLGAIFKIMRSKILATPMNDTQGSFIGNGKIIRKHLKNTKEEGFLVTTELFINLHSEKIKVIEIPCHQSETKPRKSTIKVRTVVGMAFGLIRIWIRRTLSR